MFWNKKITALQKQIDELRRDLDSRFTSSVENRWVVFINRDTFCSQGDGVMEILEKGATEEDAKKRCGSVAMPHYLYYARYENRACLVRSPRSFHIELIPKTGEHLK